MPTKTDEYEYRPAVGWEEGEAVHYGHAQRSEDAARRELEFIKLDKGRYYPVSWIERRPYTPWERLS